MHDIAKDWQVLAGRLRRMEPDEIVRYDELNALIGGDVRAGARHSLVKAREVVEREAGVIFRSVLATGIRRIPANEVGTVVVGDGLARINRSARRIVKRASAVLAGPASPDGEERSQLGYRIAVAAAVAQATTQSQLESKLVALANNNGPAVPPEIGVSQ